MTQDIRLVFWFVVAVALILAGVWAAYRMFFANRRAGTAPAEPVPEKPAAELLHVDQEANGRTRIRLRGRELLDVAEIADPQVGAALHALLAALGGAAPAMPPGATLSDAPRVPLSERARESFPARATPADQPGRAPAAGETGAGWMFERINEIVEQLRRDAPGMPEIELSAEGQEIRVWLAGQAYRGIDDVPDEKARALIRAAIAQWERE